MNQPGAKWTDAQKATQAKIQLVESALCRARESQGAPVKVSPWPVGSNENQNNLKSAWKRLSSARVEVTLIFSELYLVLARKNVKKLSRSTNSPCTPELSPRNEFGLFSLRLDWTFELLTITENSSSLRGRHFIRPIASSTKTSKQRATYIRGKAKYLVLNNNLKGFTLALGALCGLIVLCWPYLCNMAKLFRDIGGST